MGVEVLFPPNKEMADLQAIICAVAMKSTRRKEPAHEIIAVLYDTNSCKFRKGTHEANNKHECFGSKVACSDEYLTDSDEYLTEDSLWKGEKFKCEQFNTCVVRLLRDAKIMKHWGVFEHTMFTVSVSGVSRALTHQLVRHRQDSFLQQSQRAVEIDVSKGDWYVIPKTIAGTGWERVFQERMKEIGLWYKELCDAGIPEEDARYYLPNACKTNIVITANARQWLHIFYMRLSEHAQWEIREMAQSILGKFMKLSPIIFEGAGELNV